jgi:hypothetical protein
MTHVIQVNVPEQYFCKKIPMAKTSTNPKTTAGSTSTPQKKVTAPKSKPESKKAGISIETACETALTKLRDLDIEHALQADLQWCLGSYHADGNPVGLYQMLDRAVAVLEREKIAKTKGVTAKMVNDLAKVLKA